MTVPHCKAAFVDSICPNFENLDERHPVMYKRQNGRYAHNILELRAWKKRRAIELPQVGCESWLSFAFTEHARHNSSTVDR